MIFFIFLANTKFLNIYAKLHCQELLNSSNDKLMNKKVIIKYSIVSVIPVYRCRRINCATNC